MQPIISMNNVGKDFKVLNRHEGLKGAIKDLFSKDYKIVKAVDNINFEVMPGEIVGYLGPNGAGKSTTIKMMTGILTPSKGTILVNGKIPYDNRTQNAQNIGVVFGQRSQLWWSLPAIESFKILKDIYHVSDKEYKNNLELFDSLLHCQELLRKPVREMSLGQRTLCDILAAFLHNPDIIFLDEPTIGLDVSMKSKIREFIKILNQKKGTTVLLTTHDMGDVDALCKRIIIIDKGTILYDNSIETLRLYFGKFRTLRINIHDENKHSDLEYMKKKAEQIEMLIKRKFTQITSLSMSVDESWLDILINENEVSVIEVFNSLQSEIKILDMTIKDITTESVIKKIYEGNLL